jgi:hypothetical protein
MTSRSESSSESFNTSTPRRQTASKPSSSTRKIQRWSDTTPLLWPSELASRTASEREAERQAKLQSEPTPAPEPKRRRWIYEGYTPRSKIPARKLELVRALHNLRRYRWKLRKDPTNPTLIRGVQRCIERVEAERHNRKMIADAKERGKLYQRQQQHRKLRPPITAEFVDYLSEVDTTNTGWTPPQRLAG